MGGGGGGVVCENVCNLNILLLILNMHSEKYALMKKKNSHSLHTTLDKKVRDQNYTVHFLKHSK